MSNLLLPIDQIDAMLRDRAVELVSHLIGKRPNKRLSRRGEVRFGRKGGISVATAGHARGRITLFDGDGKGRSPLQFIQYELNCNFGEAVSWAGNWLDLDANYQPDRQNEEERRQNREEEEKKAIDAEKQELRKKINKAINLAEKSVPLTGTNGEAYLRNQRGITKPPPDSIRYLPRENALVVLATTEDGNLQAVQCIYLDGDRKSTTTEILKRTFGVLKYVAVRLPGKGHRLYLAEGPETALSVWQATGSPTWAVLGQNFRDHNIPNEITEIVIAADNDEEASPAYKQANKSAEYYFQRGYNVSIARPVGPPKYDFNDIHMALGEQKVRELLEAAPQWTGIGTLYDAPKGSIEQARHDIKVFIDEWVSRTQAYWKPKGINDGTH